MVKAIDLANYLTDVTWKSEKLSPLTPSPSPAGEQGCFKNGQANEKSN